MVTQRGEQYAPVSNIGRVNWGAIFAGTFITLFFQLLFGLLGLAIGLTAFDPGQTATRGYTIGATIWIILATLISVFIGAFAAGRLSGLTAKYDGFLHGIATLAFLTIISIFLFTTGFGAALGGVMNVGVEAAKLPQIQNVLPQQIEMGQQTGAAAQIQQQADKYATGATWITFLTALLALIAAAYGGFMGLQSRVQHTLNEPLRY